jgi:2-polyprenyl-6-methoxyphenol hydroxylase-like FAD-dependent oxidoreductase
MDLAWRAIEVIVAERRPPNDPPSVKCGQIGARSVEIFRRLGLADKLRGIGLPADYPSDIVSATSVTGIELSRVPIPARGGRGTPAAAGPDTLWPTPEHTHRCNQKFFEPVLFAHAAEQPRIRIVHRTEITDLAQGEQGVTASAIDLDTRSTIECDYSSDATGRARLCASRSAPSSSAPRCSSTRNLCTSGHRSSGVCCPASRLGPTSRSIRAAAA